MKFGPVMQLGLATLSYNNLIYLDSFLVYNYFSILLLSYIACWLLLLFGESILSMQMMQVFFGMATAANIGYYSYIYRYK